MRDGMLVLVFFLLLEMKYDVQFLNFFLGLFIILFVLMYGFFFKLLDQAITVKCDLI